MDRQLPHCPSPLQETPPPAGCCTVMELDQRLLLEELLAMALAG